MKYYFKNGGCRTTIIATDNYEKVRYDENGDYIELNLWKFLKRKLLNWRKD